MTDAESQTVALHQGLDMTTLPCFVGDADPHLVRVPTYVQDAFDPDTGGDARDEAGAAQSPTGSPPTLRISLAYRRQTPDQREASLTPAAPP